MDTEHRIMKKEILDLLLDNFDEVTQRDLKMFSLYQSYLEKQIDKMKSEAPTWQEKCVLESTKRILKD